MSKDLISFRDRDSMSVLSTGFRRFEGGLPDRKRSSVEHDSSNTGGVNSDVTTNDRPGSLSSSTGASPPIILRSDSVLGTNYVRTISSRPLINRKIEFELPSIHLVPWGGSWTKDILSLIHNAVLAELRDLFEMANVLQRRKFMLTLKHVERFYSWFTVFANFLLPCIKIEEEFLLPWITQGEAYSLRGPVRESKRMLFYGTIRRTISLILEYRDEFSPFLPVGERVNGLISLIARLEIIPKFFADAQSYIVPFIQEHHYWTPWKKSSVHRRIVLELSKSDNFERNIVILTRWFQRHRARNWVRVMLKPHDYVHFKVWWEACIREHCLFVLRLEDSIEHDSEADCDTLVGSALEIVNRGELEETRAVV